MALKLMYITNNVDVAQIAQSNGVDRIWIDLEELDKEVRQPGLDTVKSHHTIEDIQVMRPYNNKSELLVRINHWNNNSKEEINRVIAAGADIIMLPYWKTIDEVKSFLDEVNGRCKTILLLETKEGVELLDEVLRQGGFDEIHIGLNDLHLAYKKDFMFELLANGTVELLCNKISRYNIPYGFGGIAKMGAGKIPAEKILLEHYRLGSSMVILSRTFCNTLDMDLERISKEFEEGVKAIRRLESKIDRMTETEFESNMNDIKLCVGDIVREIKGVKKSDNE